MGGITAREASSGSTAIWDMSCKPAFVFRHCNGNIRYGRLDATDEEVIAAAKAVSADQVVKKLEKGYQSDVGEGGDRLSTGEKQLISFARAVLADPRILCWMRQPPLLIRRQSS